MKYTNKKYTSTFIVALLAAFAGWLINASAQAQTQSENNRIVDSSTTPQQTAAQEIQRRTRLEKKIDELLVKAKSDGLVRVIVHPRGNFLPESEEREDQAQSRRARTVTAREALVNSLQAHARGEIKTYDHTAFIAFDTDEEGLRMLRNSPDIEAVEEDVLLSPSLLQSVPLINAPHAWNLGYTGAGQVVAILDTGVDKTHPFLSNKVVKEACFSTTANGSKSVCPNGKGTMDGPGAAVPAPSSIAGFDHGTHVAGIAAGKEYEILPGVKMSGVAKDAKIVAIQVFSKVSDPTKCLPWSTPCLQAQTSDLEAALQYLVNYKYSINGLNLASVNMSLGGGKYSGACDMGEYSFVGVEINSLKSDGIATVVSTGNDSLPNQIAGPACVSNAVRVGASSKGDQVASFSNSSSMLDLLAPGVSITSSVPGNGLASWDGTSMAAPHVTGSFALLRGKLPDASVDELLGLMKRSGKWLTDPKNNRTTPRIDIGNAIDNACVPVLSSTSIQLDGEGGIFQVTANDYFDCATWKAKTSEFWIHIISPTQTVSGTHIVKFKVDPYSTVKPLQRSGLIIIGGKQFLVKQTSTSF